MALYDGFFDAVQDEETGEYDRAYSSSDFTGYYANVIGSGVCIHDNPDSFLVRLEDGAAVVSPGYLFIQGYWLKNDADYTVELPTAATYAIVAHLNRGQRLIELEARSVAQAYPDALVLAIVSPTSAEDTRHNTDICGTIDTAGELSGKVEWALNYIDNEIESKLAEAEQVIAAQERRLDAKIAQVQAVADSIVPPPIGSIKFSASEDVGDEWLRCDGSFINESDYPDLVAALGKLIPSGDKFQLLSSGEIGPQITNGAVYDGRIWVYSYATKKLYGVDVEGSEAVKEITLTSEVAQFNDFITPTVAKPLCLSIVKHLNGSGANLFLTQTIEDGDAAAKATNKQWLEYFLIFQSEFTGEESSLTMTVPFDDITFTTSSRYNYRFESGLAIPYVTSYIENGAEVYAVCAGEGKYDSSFQGPCSLTWSTGSGAANRTNTIRDGNYQRVAYSHKNKNEVVSVDYYKEQDKYRYKIYSAPNELFDYINSSTLTGSPKFRASYGPLNIAGPEVIMLFDKNMLSYFSTEKDKVGWISHGLTLPSAARVFVDGGAYLWGKDIYMIFVGTGIIFSRTLEEGDFGYLDTTDVLGTITQFGYLDYSEDEGTLYLLGQDTTNTVKVAKIVLNTLYDYANDGAWLPMIASDGVPAYIKAKGAESAPSSDTLNVNVHSIYSASTISINGELMIAGTYQYNYPGGTGTITITVTKISATSYNNINLNVNGTTLATIPGGSAAGTEKTITLNVAPYMQSGLTLKTVI